MRAQTEDGMPSGCKYNDQLVELLGVSGQDGRMGTIEKIVEEQRKTMKKIKDEQNRLAIKLAIFTGTGSLLGGGAVAIIAKIVSQ